MGFGTQPISVLRAWGGRMASLTLDWREINLPARATHDFMWLAGGTVGSSPVIKCTKLPIKTLSFALGDLFFGVCVIIRSQQLNDLTERKSCTPDVHFAEEEIE